MTIAERLRALRVELECQNLDGFIIPMADEYQNEYVPPSARRVEFITGFTGSSGTAVVMADRAAFFTDSRYTLQAQREVASDWFEIFDIAIKTPTEWLGAVLKPRQRLGYDPRLHSAAGAERLVTAVTAAGAEAAPIIRHPVDLVWKDRPAAPLTPIVLYGLDYAGVSSTDKIADLAAGLKRDGIDAALISDPASVAWLLNLRGNDVPHTPLPLSSAVLYAEGTVDWFVHPAKLMPAVTAQLPTVVRVRTEGDLGLALGVLHGRKVAVDQQLCNAWMVDHLRRAEAEIIARDDICALPRALKNPVEQAGMRAAHRRDAVALARFFAWLDAQPTGTVREIQAEEKLASYRVAGDLYRGPSFATIAGSGPHGAIVHYRATPATDRILAAGELFLLDSGGQYLDGTTDVTRTVVIGTPSATMRDHYTRVVKGHIALAQARFPAGTTGADLDVLARQYLWAAGLDYGHGTGHGVGCYLGVHEGPQGISRRATAKLQPGMVLSNEPGYYLADAYGIRFENLMLVTPAAMPAGGEWPMLGFEILTLVPLDHRLLDTALLTKTDVAWINAYHARILAEIGPLVDDETRAWLTVAARAL